MNSETGTTSGRIIWWAVAVGFLADMLLTIVISMIGLGFSINLTRGATFATGGGAILSSLLVLATGIGGWLAGRVARQEHLLHGALVGGAGIIVMLVDSLFGTTQPLSSILLQIAATVLGALGGWVSRWIPAPQQP